MASDRPKEYSNDSSATGGGDDTVDSGVKIPEAFQREAHQFLAKCNDEACLIYLRDCISKKHIEMMKGDSEGEDTMLDDEGMD